MGWSSGKKSDDGTVKKYLWSNHMEKETGRPKLKWLNCIENV